MANPPCMQSKTLSQGVTALPVKSKLLIDAIVWCLFCDMNIMRMALSEGCRRNFHKPAVILEFLDRLCAAVPHTRAETAHKLKYCVLHISLIGNASLNALRHKLLGI